MLHEKDWWRQTTGHNNSRDDSKAALSRTRRCQEGRGRANTSGPRHRCAVCACRPHWVHAPLCGRRPGCPGPSQGVTSLPRVYTHWQSTRNAQALSLIFAGSGTNISLGFLPSQSILRATPSSSLSLRPTSSQVLSACVHYSLRGGLSVATNLGTECSRNAGCHRRISPWSILVHSIAPSARW
ncbi:hypothetical protein EXIGLDRAFT_503126 [Exidia glandulosa HHB12029]|uniref:Uncharacterized protein n=1 Tax=Exidia glandulosa HHB12029 TaxID=1314781 RepID=A0A165JBV1_EXIGL|nr:hypothetical protein EXIGLDRAFT_503126 [Exidia glandulosa HHB12029]